MNLRNRIRATVGRLGRGIRNVANRLTGRGAGGRGAGGAKS